MQLIVVLSADAARGLQRGTSRTSETKTLLGVAESLGASLDPLHPGTSDATLARYFRMDVADADAARRAIERLGQSKLVEAAYVKPPDALP